MYTTRKDIIEQLHLKYHEDKDANVIEIIGTSHVVDLDNPYLIREPNQEYIRDEIAWYESMSLDIRNLRGINNIPKAWKMCADRNYKVRSNYGAIVAQNSGGYSMDDTLDIIVDGLFHNKERRDMRIMYADFDELIYTTDSIATRYSRDTICTNSVQYLFRDDTLHVIVSMRSNDVVYGYNNDVAWQLYLAKKIQSKLKRIQSKCNNIKMYWQVGSLHVYSKHKYLLKSICTERNCI